MALMGDRADRVKSREELQRELAELWAASKQPPTASCTVKEQAQLQQEQQLRQSHDTVLGRTDSTRKSKENEKRKASSERSSSEAHKGDKYSAGSVGGSQDSAAGLWSTQAVPKCDAGPHPYRADSDSSPCIRWLPFKAITSTLRRYPGIWLSTLLLFLTLSTGGIIGVVFIAANETHQRRMSAEGFALNAAVAFERQLAQMFFPLLSLATIVRFDPYYPRFNKTFDKVAQELMEQMPTQGAVTNLIAAPQGVLRNFYPLSGYCQDKCNDININLFSNPERRDVALKTVKDGRLIMQGPMMLSQGYFGVVGRQPIYIANSTRNETFGAPDGLTYNCSVCFNETTKTQFWGFVNAVINLQSLVNGEDSRLRDLRVSGYLYEMFKYEKNGTRTMIARSYALPTEPVQADVHVPGGLWFLDVSPEQGWVPVWRAPILAVVVLVCCLFSLLLGAILVSNRLQTWLKSANDALAREKERMDVLLARQYNLISCVLQDESDGGANGKHGSVQHRTLARIENMRREIGVAQHTNGTTNGADELQLNELLDEGTYGKVFRGLWRGSDVAIKTMVLPAKMSGAEKRERMAVMEAAISSTMCHPNIVQTFTYVIKPCSTSVAQCASEDGSSSQVTAVEAAAPAGSVTAHLETPEASAAVVHNFEVSLVLEFCDWGSLRTALDAGAFFAEDNSLNYAAILDTAADVARAMLHLHKNQVLHSDLKVRNVLLKSDASGRGCIAKVADFGLAIKMDCMDTHISAFQGTMSHMAPEALLHGHISTSSDVYAYGITLWELFTGGQAYQGIPRALVGHQVAVLGLRPTLPPFTPPDFRALVEDCWHQDPEKRPSFDVVLAKLVKMRCDLGQPTTPPLQRYKLRPKVSQEGRVSSEKKVDGAAADAQAQGLMRLGSFYVNTSTCSTAPLGSSTQMQHHCNNCSGSGSSDGSSLCRSGGAGGGLASGSLGQHRQQQQQPQQQVTCNGCCNGSGGGSGGPGSNGNGSGSYRPAPRTQYMASRLYALSGSLLGPIPDTEDLEQDEEETGKQQQGQQQQQQSVGSQAPQNPGDAGPTGNKQQPSMQHQPDTAQQQQQQQAQQPAQHVQHPPAAVAGGAAGSAVAGAGELAHGSCVNGSVMPADAAATADHWPVDLPQLPQQQHAHPKKHGGLLRQQHQQVQQQAHILLDIEHGKA